MAKSKLNLTINAELKQELVDIAESTGGSISAFIENLVYLALHTNIFDKTYSNNTKDKHDG